MHLGYKLTHNSSTVGVPDKVTAISKHTVTLLQVFIECQYIPYKLQCETLPEQHVCGHLIIAGEDPGAGKGRGTNRLSCRWVRRTDSFVGCFIFKQERITS